MRDKRTENLARRAAAGDVGAAKRLVRVLEGEHGLADEARRRLEVDEKARRPLSPEDVDRELLRVAREVGAYLTELAPDVGRVAWEVASGGSGSCLSESRLGGEPWFFHARVSVEPSGRRTLATITVSRDVGRGGAPRYQVDASASMSLTDAELIAWLEVRGRPDRATGERWIPTSQCLWFDLMAGTEGGGA